MSLDFFVKFDTLVLPLRSYLLLKLKFQSYVNTYALNVYCKFECN